MVCQNMVLIKFEDQKKKEKNVYDFKYETPKITRSFYTNETHSFTY